MRVPSRPSSSSLRPFFFLVPSHRAPHLSLGVAVLTLAFAGGDNRGRRVVRGRRGALGTAPDAMSDERCASVSAERHLRDSGFFCQSVPPLAPSPVRRCVRRAKVSGVPHLPIRTAGQASRFIAMSLRFQRPAFRRSQQSHSHTPPRKRWRKTKLGCRAAAAACAARFPEILV